MTAHSSEKWTKVININITTVMMVALTERLAGPRGHTGDFKCIVSLHSVHFTGGNIEAQKSQRTFPSNERAELGTRTYKASTSC